MSSEKIEATARYGKRHASFLAAFRQDGTRELRPLTAAEFLEVWRHFDADGTPVASDNWTVYCGSHDILQSALIGNGTIEGAELDDFLREFVGASLLGTTGGEAVSDSGLELLRRDFLEAFDENRDGKLSIQEVFSMVIDVGSAHFCFIEPL